MINKNIKYVSYFGFVVMIITIMFSLVIYPIKNSFYFLLFIQSLKLQICTFLLFTYFLTLLITKQFSKITFSLIDFLIILFAAIVFLSASYARNPEFAVNVGFLWIVYYGIFKLFQCNINNEWIKKKLVYIISACLIFSLLLFSIIVFVTADYNKGIFNTLSGEQLKKIYALFQLHRNSVSSLLILSTGIPFYYIAKSKNTKQLTFGISFLALFFFVLLITRSRGSLLAFIFISGALLSVLLAKKIINLKVLILILVVLFITGFTVIQLQSNTQRYVGLLNPFYGVMSPDGDDRVSMWKLSYQLFKESPILGYGAGSWEFEYQNYGSGDLKMHHHNPHFHLHSHSYYVNVFFTNGVVGGLIFLAIIVFMPTILLFNKFRHKNNNNNVFIAQSTLFFAFMGCAYLESQRKSNKANLVFITMALFTANLYYLVAWKNSYIINKFDVAIEQKSYVESENLLSQLDNTRFGYLSNKTQINKLWYITYTQQKKYDEAVSSIEKALVAHPYNWVFYGDLGDVLFLQNKYKKAKAAYNNSLLYNCDYIPASIGLLKCEAALGNGKEVNTIKTNLLYINDYIKQYEQNENSWKQYEKLTLLYIRYRNFKIKIDKVEMPKNSK